MLILMMMDDTALAASPWEKLYQDYIATWSLPGRAHPFEARVRLVREARALFGHAHRRHAWWVMSALDGMDAGRQSFVAEVMDSNVPRRYLAAMIRAGVREPDRVKKRAFIKPCVSSYGQRIVLETLLGYLERGVDEEKSGAVIASYWAAKVEDGGYFWSTGRVLDRKTHRPTLEAQAEYASWQPLRVRLAALLIEEFKRNEDAVVRHYIVALLFLDPTYDEETLQALGPAGLDIARRHDNWYVRRRASLLSGATP